MNVELISAETAAWIKRQFYSEPHEWSRAKETRYIGIRSQTYELAKKKAKHENIPVWLVVDRAITAYLRVATL